MRPAIDPVYSPMSRSRIAYVFGTSGKDYLRRTALVSEVLTGSLTLTASLEIAHLKQGLMCLMEAAWSNCCPEPAFR